MANVSKNIAILDVETTGLDPKLDRIIQFALLTLDENLAPVKLLDSYINPGKDARDIVERSSYRFHKIGPEMLHDKPNFEAKADEIIIALREIDILVGHNILFDWGILRYEFARLDENSDEDSDDSWNASKRSMRNIDLEKPGNWQEKFDSLKFELLDTYRTAVVAYPHEPSHALSALACHFNLRIRKCHTIRYKWRGQDDGEENELKIEEKNEKMSAHNAITDVLTTAKLLKDCLKILRIKYTDLCFFKFPEYFISIPLIKEAGKLTSRRPTDYELRNLAQISPAHMNINYPCKGEKLIHMKSHQIQSVIGAISRRNKLSVKRDVLICRGFKQLAKDRESGKSFANVIENPTQRRKIAGNDNANENQDIFHGLKFGSEGKKETPCRSPYDKRKNVKDVTKKIVAVSVFDIKDEEYLMSCTKDKSTETSHLKDKMKQEQIFKCEEIDLPTNKLLKKDLSTETSPLKEKMKQAQISEFKDVDIPTSKLSKKDESDEDKALGNIVNKCLQSCHQEMITSTSPLNNKMKTRGISDISEIKSQLNYFRNTDSIQSSYLQKEASPEQIKTTEKSDSQDSATATDLLSPVFDKVRPAADKLYSESTLSDEYLAECFDDLEDKSQVFPLLNPVDQQKKNVRKKLIMSQDY